MRGAAARASGTGFGMLVARVLVACAVLAPGGVAQALDANTASADDLQTIRGIGPATAARILEARQREPFRDLDDLRDRVSGIGEKKLRKLQQAGLAVGSEQVSEGPGRARVIEPAAASRTSGSRNIEWHVGRAR